MKEGKIVGLNESWYFKAINEQLGTVICSVLGKHYKEVFSLPINSMIVRDVIGVYEEKLYEKHIAMPEFEKSSMLVDPYNMYYHHYLADKLWINVALYNTPTHGNYISVRAELHPLNAGVSLVQAINIDEVLAGDRIAAIVMRKLKEVDHANEIIFSSENEAILVRSLRKKRIDHVFSQYIRLETCGKTYSEQLTEQIMSRINQTNFSSLITGTVSAVFKNTDGLEMVVFSDGENGFLIPSKLLEEKHAF